MSRKSMKELQSRYIAGEPVSEDEQRSLLQWLEENPAQRDELLTDAAINGQLRCMARLNDKDLSEAFVQQTVERAVALKQKKPQRKLPPPRRKQSQRSLPRFVLPAGLCTAVVILVATGLVWYATAVYSRNEFGFARIVDTEALKWEVMDAKSRRLNITSGAGEVRFENGVIAQLAAPGVIELKAPGRMFVQRGSVRVDVPPAATGFTVETPLARIVDLGTSFDVDVAAAGRTETTVRSGTVTLETHAMRPAQRQPIKLTSAGLQRASVELSALTAEVRSIAVTASGRGGRFYGMIDAGGHSKAFATRQKYDDFLRRLRTAVEKHPAPFSEQWKTAAQVSADKTDNKPESGGEPEIPREAPPNRAQQMLIEQLRSMREFHRDNPQMQDLLDRMIRQAEETPK